VKFGSRAGTTLNEDVLVSLLEKKGNVGRRQCYSTLARVNLSRHTDGKLAKGRSRWDYSC
jgi:hypothetical protein